MAKIERRAAPRVSVSLPITLETDDGFIGRGTIENLSETGMLVVTEDEIPLEVQVRIIFSKQRSDTSVELRGQVVRSAALGQYGVAFIEVGERSREIVRQGMMREM